MHELSPHIISTSFANSYLHSVEKEMKSCRLISSAHPSPTYLKFLDVIERQSSCRFISSAPPSPTKREREQAAHPAVAASYHKHLLRQEYGFIPLNPFLSNNNRLFISEFG